MAGKEILWKFGIDLTPYKQAFQQIADLQSDQADEQKRRQEDEQKALDDYANSIKEIISTATGFTSELEKQSQLIKEISDSYREMAQDARTRLDTEVQASRQVSSRSTGGTANAPDWMTATAQLRANIAQETLSTKQIGDERQRIINLIDSEIEALRTKDSLSTKELSDLKKLTLERERQADALATGAKIGLTAGTKQALGSVGGDFIQSIGGALAGGGAAGELTSGIIGGITGGGFVMAAEGVAKAIEAIVSEVISLVGYNDRLINVENVFDRLSQGIGAAPAQFINDLKEATHGLVDTTDLMTQANRLMLQGLPFTNEQITSLIKSVSTLALVQGKDATQSMDMISRALSSGRLSMLAYNLNLEESTKKQLQNASSLSDNARLAEEYAIVLKAVNEQLAKTGDYQETAGTKMRQAGVAFHDLLSDMSTLVASSPVAEFFTSLIDKLDQYIKKVREASLATPQGRVEALATEMQKKGTLPPEMEDKLIAMGVLPPKSLKAAPGTPQSIVPFAPQKGFELPNVITVTGQQGPVDWAQQKKQAEEAAKVRAQDAQQAFDAEKARLDQLAAINKQAHDAGNRDLQTYTAKQEEISKARYEAEVKLINAQAETSKVGLEEDDKRSKAEDITEKARADRKKAIDDQIAVIDAQTKTKLGAAQYKYELEQITANDQMNADERKADEEHAQALLAKRRSDLDSDKQVLEKNFTDGLVSAEEYTKKRIDLIADVSIAEKQAEDKRDELAQKGDAETTLHAANIAKIEQQAAKDTQAVTLATLDTILKAEEERFTRKKALLEADLAIAKSTGDRSAEQEILRQLIILDQQQIQLDGQHLTSLDAADVRYAQIQTRIQQNRDAQINWNKEIIKSVDILQPMADITGRLSKAVGGMSQSWMQGLSSLSSFIGALATTQTGLITRMQSQGATNVSAGMGSPAIAMAAIRNLVSGPGMDPLTGQTSKYASTTEMVTGKLTKFGDALEASISAVSGWMQVASGQQGPVAGGISGGIVGLQTGQGITSTIGSLGKKGGALDTMMSGPIGAAISIGTSIVGGIIGVFSGKAKKKTEEIAKGITDAFNNVTTSLNTGAVTLQQAIGQTMAMRAQAISTLSGQKGGQDQLDKMLPQMDQTIASLQAKQAQIFKTFDDALVVLRSPEAFRSFTQSVDGLLQKYQDYIDAGGNVALANEFLQRSFQDLQSSVGDQVTTAQTKAVQDAIDYNNQLQQQADLVTQLNDLETQRADILNQQSISIEDILGKGALTRQRTLAMTEGAQVAAVEANTQNQLTALDKQKQGLLDQQDLLNNQIKVSDYRLSIESKMFTIAQNKYDLEAQMVTLQEQAADKDLDNVKAMQQELNVMSSATDASTLAAGGILAAIQNLVNTLTGGTGIAPSGPQSSVPKYWTFTLAPWTGQQMPNDMYQAEIAKMIAAQSHKPLQGTDAMWLQGLQSAVPHYAAGIASVPQDQLAVVHKGETIIPAGGASGGNMAAILEVVMKRMQSEMTILSIANQRVKLEAQILNMRMAEINALKDALSSASSTSEMLQGAYSERGRMATGQFYGELA